jgi:hypothetical protein
VNLLAARSREEDGAVLLIALGFLAFIGVVAAVLLNYATTSIRDTGTLRDIRAREYAADGVVDAAINKVRGDISVSNSNSCLAATLNGINLRVDCSDTVGDGVDVTFTACPATAPQPCPANMARLVTRVHYIRSVTPAGIAINAWSLQR